MSDIRSILAECAKGDLLKTKRLQVEMSEEQYELLKKLAGAGGISNLVRKALNTEVYLDEAAQAKAKILIERPDGSVHELVRV
jgi:hypothetical protein